MTRIRPVLVGVCLFVFFGSSIFGAGNNLAKYRKARKDPWVAMGMALAVPSLGHLYVGDVERGKVFLYSELAGVGFLAYLGSNSEPLSTKIGIMQTVGVILGVLKVWEMVDAFDAAEDENWRLRRELEIRDLGQGVLADGVRVAFVGVEF